MGRLIGMAIAAACGVMAFDAGAQGMSAPAADKDMIASAMAAAPPGVAKDATIVALEADGKAMRTLRQGKNGFTCMPDNPATPGPDPMCMDKNAMEWVHAWIGHRPPAAGKIGFMYMLAGGTDASNTDPYAVKPEAGKHWVKTGPHVMIVGAEPAFYEMYLREADPGTPYRHLMVPIR